MPDLTSARHLPGARFPQALSGGEGSGGERTRPAWWPTWSVPAGLRTLRAVLVIPSLFALTFEGFGNLQMALFAAFGGFASLVMVSFGGSRRDKLIAHFGLAVIGSLGLIIGTAVNGITWLAVLVTIPVTFGIFFAGVAGPNAASGVTAAQPDRELLILTAGMLRQTGDLLAGTTSATPDITAMERQREAATAYHQSAADRDIDSVEIVARHAFHAQAIALVVRNIVADALIATRRADPETIAARRLSWYGAQPEGTTAERRAASIAGAMGVLTRHASFRSVWFLNSLRGSLALAAAVLVADISDVQHGFWVVLGTLSVLRTNAASTESTALRALGGTVLGFVLGALLLLGIGTSPAALWVALPIAVAVAAYAPGVLPFTIGQAAFTVVVLVLFNLLAPAGWKVGLLRIADVAIGSLVSLAVGVLFWPRGAASVVGDDLADAFRRGAAYLTQAVDWALGTRHEPPDAGAAAATAGIRLDEALRGFLAEQGAKRVSKEDLWMLVMASTRLRLTAYSLAGMQAPEHLRQHKSRSTAYARAALAQAAADLAGFYERVAVLVGRPMAGQVLLPVKVPSFTGLNGTTSGAGSRAAGDAEASSVAVMAAPAGDADGLEQAGALVRVITTPHH